MLICRNQLLLLELQPIDIFGCLLQYCGLKRENVHREISRLCAMGVEKESKVQQLIAVMFLRLLLADFMASLKQNASRERLWHLITDELGEYSFIHSFVHSFKMVIKTIDWNLMHTQASRQVGRQKVFTRSL
jgi:DMSO/TMAO reductase YedYZ heme-binding membrane subunit